MQDQPLCWTRPPQGGVSRKRRTDRHLQYRTGLGLVCPAVPSLARLEGAKAAGKQHMASACLSSHPPSPPLVPGATGQ